MKQLISVLLAVSLHSRDTLGHSLWGPANGVCHVKVFQFFLLNTERLRAHLDLRGLEREREFEHAMRGALYLQYVTLEYAIGGISLMSGNKSQECFLTVDMNL